MFTKKTRVFSVIITVCMLLSLMAGFCLPAAAEGNNDESETLVALSIQRYIPTPIGYFDEPMAYGPATVTYHVKGSEYYPAALEGYELENGTEIPLILDEDTTINYYMIEPDYTYVSEAQTMLDSYDPDLYGEETTEIINNLQTAVDNLDDLEGESADAQIAALYEVMLYYYDAKEAMESGDLNLEYPNLPALSQYEKFSGMGITDWGIKTKADWVYATEMDPAIASTLRLHLTNDIDMEGTNVMPLAYTVGFNGLIDGHGYSFYDFKMEHADTQGLANTTAGNEVSWGLVPYLNSAGVIQNLGLASGIMRITGIGSQEQGVGGFAGVAHGSSKIVNCWNGLDIYATNKNSPSRVGGIVGRGYGVLYGCYNAGTVSGNSAYIHGLNAYAQNGNGKFYNCFNLPSSSTIGNHTAAIGQGGSYQTNAAAATSCYQNTYSIQNYLIWGYNNMANSAVTALSKSHTLTWDDYNSGYMAYTMNKDHYDYAGVDRVYWTLDAEGNTVHGTEANAVRKLTLMLDGEVLIEQYVNGDATFAVEYDNYEIADVAVEKGSAVVSGENMNLLTMGGTDVTVSFSVICKHTDTAEYTENADGTHDWLCTACGDGEEGVTCAPATDWTDGEDGTHSATCGCGRTFTEKCRFRTAAAVEGEDHHILTCKCGAEKEEACTYECTPDAEGTHTYRCTTCGNGTTEACVLSDWTVVKVPTYDEEGEERKTCICGRYDSKSIAKLTGSAVTLSAPVAHADETVTVTVNLNQLPATGISGFVAAIEYDADIFTYESIASDKFGATNVISNVAGRLTFALAGDTNVTDGTAVATITFKVAKDAPAGKSLMTVTSAEAEYVPDGEITVETVALTGSLALIDVAAYAWGDANGNKDVSIADVVFLLRVVNGVQITPDAAADVWSDTTGAPGADGAYTTADAVLILRYLLGEYDPQA